MLHFLIARIGQEFAPTGHGPLRPGAPLGLWAFGASAGLTRAEVSFLGVLKARETGAGGARRARKLCKNFPFWDHLEESPVGEVVGADRNVGPEAAMDPFQAKPTLTKMVSAQTSNWKTAFLLKKSLVQNPRRRGQ